MHKESLGYRIPRFSQDNMIYQKLHCTFSAANQQPENNRWLIIFFIIAGVTPEEQRNTLVLS